MDQLTLSWSEINRLDLLGDVIWNQQFGSADLEVEMDIDGTF